jgi:plasmid stabilization system protein ParE
MIRWTEQAAQDALNIWDFIALQSPSYADAVYRGLLRRPDQLEMHPESGSIVPEFGREDIREIFLHRFRIIYRVVGTEVRILTIIHGSRQMPTIDEISG